MMHPESPSGAPLQRLTPDRINQQRDSSLYYSTSSHPEDMASNLRDGSVHDKINQFNTLAAHSRQLERKTADAALKRAMIGREEAEGEMRRYRDEARSLRKQLEDGRERERKVGERLETVMENYGRAKETYAHTQALWEKEIRRARKEAFKSQSDIVKLQEELKSARILLKKTEDGLEIEKERSKVREEEAFAARYQLVSVQEELEKALKQIKLVEQERDAFKTVAKNEEVARIAAEGRIPLPPPPSADDEFASPEKQRASLSSFEIQSSAASRSEIEELAFLLDWERQRAGRAIQEVDFLKAECELKCCSCSRASHTNTPQQSVADKSLAHEPPAIDLEAVNPAEMDAVGLLQAPLPKQRTSQRAETSKPMKRQVRRSTIFIPSEGTFRTVSQEEADKILAAEKKSHVQQEEEPSMSTTIMESEPHGHARTPSADPPTCAIIVKERPSLQSLLDAPHQGEEKSPTQAIKPTEKQQTWAPASSNETTAPPPAQEGATETSEDDTRPHTSAAFYTVTTTTTVPLRETGTNSLLRQKLRTPKSGSFDVNNPALTPTMTREEALAQIRARRGRARSMANGTMTPRRQILQGVGERRDVSAPVGRAVSKIR